MTEQAGWSDRDRNGGFALIAVFSFLLLAAAVLVPFLTGARTRALVARNVAGQMKDSLALRGLITIAATRYAAQARLTDQPLPRHVVCAAGAAEVQFSFQNHAGLIDLNAASPDLLALGFRALGNDPDHADHLADAIVLYRTVAAGQEPDTALAVRGGYRHGPFESVVELEDFEDPEAVSLAAAADVFTVYSGAGTVYGSEAPAALDRELSRLPQSAAPFVVAGRPSAIVVSIGANIVHEAKPAAGAQAIVRARDGAQGFAFLTPVTLLSGDAAEPASIATTPCAAFFGDRLTASIAGLAGS